MTVAVVGRTAALRTPPASAFPLVAPWDLASAAHGLSRAVIIGPRHVEDDDLAAIRTVPTIFVIETGTDFVHMRMHLTDRRVTLTPFDRIHVLPAAEPSCFANPWVEPYRCGADDIAAFLQAGIPGQGGPGQGGPGQGGPVVPEGFEDLTKADFDHIARHLPLRAAMKDTSLVGLHETCRMLAGCLFDPTRIRLHGVESHAPVDVMVGPPETLAGGGADRAFRGLWLVPTVLSNDNPTEVLLARFRSMTRSALHLLDLFALPATGRRGTPVILTIGFG